MAKKLAKHASPLSGRWRITWMDQWDQEYVDAEVNGFFEFRPGGRGEFHFGYVRGQIDYREGTRDGQPCVEFSWEGNDEMDPVQGRGWAVLNGSAIEGLIAFHLGDESRFRAIRAKGKSG